MVTPIRKPLTAPHEMGLLFLYNSFYRFETCWFWWIDKFNPPYRLATELNKPISFFIPEITFFTSLHDIHNKDEEELLNIFRSMEYEPFGDPQLVLRIVKMLYAYDKEVFERMERGYPDEEEEDQST